MFLLLFQINRSMFMENGREKLDLLKRTTMAWWKPESVVQIVAKSKQLKQSSEKLTLELLCANKNIHEIANSFESKLSWKLCNFRIFVWDV